MVASATWRERKSHNLPFAGRRRQNRRGNVARVTVEDCLDRVSNHFALCILAAERARQLAAGSIPLVVCHNKAAVTALREIGGGRVSFKENVDETVRTFLAVRRDDGAIVGAFTLSQIFLGSFRSAYLGYWVGAPHARQGYMAEGIELLLRHAFRTLGLHRVEANLQPGNGASRALVRRAGFRLEGFSPRYLRIAGRWRDHERWAITVEDFRASGRR